MLPYPDHCTDSVYSTAGVCAVHTGPVAPFLLSIRRLRRQRPVAVGRRELHTVGCSADSSSTACTVVHLGWSSGVKLGGGAHGGALSLTAVSALSQSVAGPTPRRCLNMVPTRQHNLSIRERCILKFKEVFDLRKAMPSFLCVFVKCRENTFFCLGQSHAMLFLVFFKGQNNLSV